MSRFFAPTRWKLLTFLVIVLLQFLVAGVALQCGWALMHGAGTILPGICLAVAIIFIFPSAAMSSGWIPFPVPHMAFFAIEIVLNGLWGYVLACLAVFLWEKWRLRKRRE